MVLADHDFDIDAEVVGVAENFYDAAAGILRWAGPVSDFYVYDHTFQVIPFGAAGGLFAEDTVGRGVGFFFINRCFWRVRWILVALGDDDFLRDLLVDGRDVVMAAAVVERANDSGVGAVDGAENAALGAAVGAHAADFNENAVAMH